MTHHIAKSRKPNNVTRLQRRTRLFHEVVEQLEQRLLLAADLEIFPDAAGGPLPNQSQAWDGYQMQSSGEPAGGGIIKTIANVPAYIWTHGCGPTAAGMVMGYWDLHGYPNLVPGDATTQTTAVNDMIANAQHYNDYSVPLDGFGNIMADKSSTGGAHASNCIGDYMRTSWSSLALPYGWSGFGDVDSAMDSYANQRGYAGATVAEETWGAFTWSDLVGQIDAGRPMVFLVDSDGNGGTDHFVPIIGYDTGTTRYACYDTWDTSIHWYDFRAMSSSYAWGIFGATYFNPGPGAILPDLQGWDCYAPTTGVWGQNITVNSQIRNNASVLVEDSFYVQYYLSNDATFGDADDVLLSSYLHSADVPSSGYGPDYNVTLTLPETIPAGYSATGTIYIGMKTDGTNAIAESNEANNFGTQGIGYDFDSLTVSPSFDLSGYDCYAPESANWGQTISVQSQIRNAGSTTVTDNFYVDYFMSNDSIFGDADDYYLNYYTHSADVPASGYGPDFTMDLALPLLPPSGYTTSCTIYIGMQTDSMNQVAESDETNNFGTVGYTYDRDSLSVTPSYDLASWDCYAPASAVWGQTFTLSSQIRNYGPTTVTESFFIYYTLSNDTLFGDADDIYLGYYLHNADVPGSGYGPDYAVDLTLPATIPAGYSATGTIYIGTLTDVTNVISESDETNNFGAGTIGYGWDSLAVSPSYDLAGYDCYALSSAVWGQTLTMDGRISNYGSTTVTGAFYVDYYLSNDSIFGDADDIMLGWYTHTDDVPAGSRGPTFTKDLTLPATIPAGYSATGTIYIGMKSDGNGSIAETNETNNFGAMGSGWDWASMTTSASYDLSGYDCYPVSARWGETMSVQSQMRNQGPTTLTDWFYIDYYLSNDTVFGNVDDVLLYRYTHGASVGGNGYDTDFTVNMPLPSAIPGGYPITGTAYVGMRTDPTNRITETNETNNFASVGQSYDWNTVTLVSPYDLQGSTCSAPATASWGQTITMQSQIYNNGAGTVTPSFDVEYYLSNDSVFGDADDILLGTYPHSADVPANGYGTLFAKNLPLPATIPTGYSATGTIYIGMKTDSGNAIVESNETNNFGTVGLINDYDTVAVSPSYDLIGLDCYAAATGVWGETVSVQSQIRNAGLTTVTDFFYVNYYLSSDSIFGDADDVYLGYYTHTDDVPGGGAAADFSLDLTLPATIPTGYTATGTVYIGMMTDSTSRIAETNETNNFGVIGQGWDWDSLTTNASYDLAGWDCYPATATWSQTLSVPSQIRNYGPTTVTGTFYVDYYLSNDSIFGDADDYFLGYYTHSEDVFGYGYGPEITASLTLPAPLAGYPIAGTVYVGMKTDALNQITESNETNNFAAYGESYDWNDFTVISPYDLCGYDCFATDTANWGQTISVQSQIYNSGPVAVTPSFNIEYYLSSDSLFGDADDILLGTYLHADDVPAAGYGLEFTKSLILPATIPTGYPATGTVYIGMKTDSGNAIVESNETNNFGTIGLTYDRDSVAVSPAYDLAGYDCYALTSAVWGGTLTMDGRISNYGSTTVTGAFYVDYYLSNDSIFGDADDIMLGWYTHTDDVPAGSRGPTFTKDLTLPATIPTGYSATGTIYIGMKSDGNGSIAETNETNNFGAMGSGWDWASMTTSASYDLAGWQCFPAAATWGQTLSVPSQIVNYGPTTVTSMFYVDYYLSNDSIFGDADDHFLGYYTHNEDVPGNGVGPGITASLTLPAPLTGYPIAGTVYIGMKTDALNNITESNETNNFATVGESYDWNDFTVVSPYNLSGFVCTAPATANWGLPITVSSQIANSGNFAVTDTFNVQYYLSNDSVYGDADDISLGTYVHSADVPAAGNGPAFNKDLTLPATVPAGYSASSTVYIGMKTDSSDLVPESDESNNFGAMGQNLDWDSLSVSPGYDLLGYDCYAPMTANWGQTITMDSQIRNAGPTTVSATFYVDYYLSNDSIFGDADDIMLGWYTHSDDVPGNGYGPDFTKNLTLPATVPAGYAGTSLIYIGMKSDGDNTIAETNEANNFGVQARTFDWDDVNVSPSYDLAGYQCLAPASAIWGQTITMNAQIQSPGLSTVTDFFHVDFYLSNDTVFGDADDVLLGFHTQTDDVPGSGTSPAFTKDLILPASAPGGYSASGTFYIGMKTDSDNRITETNEVNNFGTMGQNVDWDLLAIAPANSAPTDIAISTSSVAENLPSATAVGNFTTSDPDVGDTFTYSLVSGTGSADNSSFTISGNQLRTAASFNYEAKSSYSIRVRSTDAGGLNFEKTFTVNVTDVDEIAPTVTAVYVKGSTWASGYLSFLAANTSGSSSTYGFAVPVGSGSAQLQTLPWRNLNRISIAFSEDVSVSQAQFAIVGSVGSYSVSAFSYSSTDHVATWSLSAAIGPDKLYVALPGTGTTAVKDATGNVLDGEWNNPTSYSQVGSTDTFPSGNGSAGGDFAFRFDVLPGDSTGGSLGKVNVADVAQTKSRSTLPVSSSSYRSDFDGNNLINVADVAYVKSKSSIYSLPVNPPVLPVFGLTASQENVLLSPEYLLLG